MSPTSYSLDARSGAEAYEQQKNWGELLTRTQGEKPEECYKNIGEECSYMYFWNDGAIDASEERPIPCRSRVGRLINHSISKANIETVLREIIIECHNWLFVR